MQPRAQKFMMRSILPNAQTCTSGVAVRAATVRNGLHQMTQLRSDNSCCFGMLLERENMEKSCFLSYFVPAEWWETELCNDNVRLGTVLKCPKSTRKHGCRQPKEKETTAYTCDTNCAFPVANISKIPCSLHELSPLFTFQSGWIYSCLLQNTTQLWAHHIYL